jgi:hypothetical protein
MTLYTFAWFIIDIHTQTSYIFIYIYIYTYCFFALAIVEEEDEEEEDYWGRGGLAMGKISCNIVVYIVMKRE